MFEPILMDFLAPLVKVHKGHYTWMLVISDGGGGWGGGGVGEQPICRGKWVAIFLGVQGWQQIFRGGG